MPSVASLTGLERLKDDWAPEEHVLTKVAEHIMCQLSSPTGVDTAPISTVGLLWSSAELRDQAPRKKKIIVVCYTATGEAECLGR